MNYQQFIIGAVTTADSYSYLTREMQKPLHPVVVALLNVGAFEPETLGDLTREWPHVSKDGKRVAYTVNVAKGEEDRQSVVSIGDFLTRYI